VPRAVFLDRDGVLNRALVRDGKPYPPRRLSELEILPGAAEACRTLGAAGFRLIVVSNQPDVGRGILQRATVEAINGAIRARVPLDEFRVCYHSDEDHCHCRKPDPGLLLETARLWAIDLSESFLVGDRAKDIEAGRRAGCRTIFIDYSYREARPDRPDATVDSLSKAAQWILLHSFSRRGHHAISRQSAD
jgi:D-glycero-D-manno-heptose 1,7-bisphosphate phosphatase